MLYYQSGAATDTGKRNNNQDNYFLNGAYNPEIHADSRDEQVGQAHFALFAVADGMGGENSGERASYLLVKRLSEIVLESDTNLPATVTQAILDTNDALCAIMKQENAGRMGSTVVTILIAESSVYINNLGDSPAYLCRDDTLKKLTRDHTEGQAMLDGGVLTEEQLAHHASKNRLTRHLGIFPSELELEVAQYDLIVPAQGDIFLLCSDGISGVFSEKQLMNHLLQKKSAAALAEDIVSEAIHLGSKDNCTALVVKFARKPFPASGPKKPVHNINPAEEEPTFEVVPTTDDGKQHSVDAPTEIVMVTESVKTHKPERKERDKKKRVSKALFVALLVLKMLILTGVGYMILKRISALR